VISLHWFIIVSSTGKISVAAANDGVGVVIGVWVGVGTRMDGRHAGSSCAACVVVFFDGSKAERGMA
jgi:hypothetical protein